MAWRARLVIAAVVVCFATPSARAQFSYDVPFVPTPYVVVEEMLRLAKVGADDFVMDLGSGDGRILIAAARKFGARGVGVDLDPDRIEESLYSAQLQGVSDRVTFLQQDLFKFDLSSATVITMYLLPSVNMKLRSRLYDLKPGTRIVAHDFDLEDWQPDQKSTVRKNVFLWIVPAKAGGRWRTTVALPAGERTYDIEIRQKFQEIDGLARYDKKVAGLWNAKLSGERINFVIVDDSGSLDSNLYFDGKVSADGMEGTIVRGVGADQKQIPWRATRLPEAK
ncbi:MAG TPA: methyltransferase domain-containing protein [Burkholderiales bacterium]|jgi:SAM-dependent methyltransferase|nr:methyltransferase domain-containing protein [Burkholderiales bacterium]